MAINETKSVIATFYLVSSPPPGAVNYTLTVSKTGSGSGIVVGPGINCGSDCNEFYVNGTLVTLTAAPFLSSVFAGWTGACTGTNVVCTLLMNSNKNAQAQFNTQSGGDNVAPLLLQISPSPTSLSSVLVSWQTNELADSQVEYGSVSSYGSLSQLNTTMSLSHAVPLFGLYANTLYHYRVISKDASGNTNKSVDSTFYIPYQPPQNRTESLRVSVTGSGYVSSSPQGILCSYTQGNCYSEFDKDTRITLTANAYQQFHFDKWNDDGVCKGQGAVCTFTLSTSQQITAQFLHNYR